MARHISDENIFRMNLLEMVNVAQVRLRGAYPALNIAGCGVGVDKDASIIPGHANGYAIKLKIGQSEEDHAAQFAATHKDDLKRALEIYSADGTLRVPKWVKFPDGEIVGTQDSYYVVEVPFEVVRSGLYANLGELVKAENGRAGPTGGRLGR
jgi:hypothetical protein